MTLRAVPGENPTLSVSTDAELSATSTGYLLDGDFLFSKASGVYILDKTSTASLSSTILPTLESAGGTLAGRLFFTGIGPTGGGGSSGLPPLPTVDGDYVLRVVSGVGTWVENPTFQSVTLAASGNSVLLSSSAGSPSPSALLVTDSTGLGPADIMSSGDMNAVGDVISLGDVQSTSGDVRGKTLTIHDGADKTFATDPTDPSAVYVSTNFRGPSILSDYFTAYTQFRLRNSGSGDVYNVAQFDSSFIIISDATLLTTRLDGIGVSIPGIYLDLSGASTELRLSGSPGAATERVTSQGVGVTPTWSP